MGNRRENLSFYIRPWCTKKNVVNSITNKAVSLRKRLLKESSKSIFVIY